MLLVFLKLTADQLLGLRFRAQAMLLLLPWSFERWAIRRINRYLGDKCYKTKHVIRWRVIYPGDSVVHLSNNQRQEEREGVHTKAKSRRQLNPEALLTFLSTQSSLGRYLIYCVGIFYNFRYTRYYPASSCFLLHHRRPRRCL